MRRALLAAAVLALNLNAGTYYVTVAGSGGLPEYAERFSSMAKELDKLLRASPNTQVETLEGPAATRAKLRTVLGDLSNKLKPEDELVVILIGHGTFDGDEYKFNIPGPDITGTELGALLDKVPTGRQVVVNTTSASGGAIDELRRPNRVVLSATRSGTEKNATHFARYFVEAFRDPQADTDKNEMLSALEAFKYADQKTAKFYEAQKRLATEHAVLEDTGKGEGVRTPSPENGQGLLAARFPLLRFGAAQKAAASPEKQKLLAKKEQLESEVEKLKYEKAAMPVDEYRKKLSALLLELARTTEELDK